MVEEENTEMVHHLHARRLKRRQAAGAARRSLGVFSMAGRMRRHGPTIVRPKKLVN
jgi:hypothetical protein